MLNQKTSSSCVLCAQLKQGQIKVEQRRGNFAGIYGDARNSLNLAGKLFSPENLAIPNITNKSPLTSKPNSTLNSKLNSP